MVRKNEEVMKNQVQLDKVADMLKRLTQNCFYGSILLKFENGKIVHVKKEESIKLT